MSDEHATACWTMPHATKEYANIIKRKNALKSVLTMYDDITWNPWQAGILDMIDEKPDPRKVYWLYDECGNIGKSHLTTYLNCKGKAYCPDVTKVQDIYFGYAHRLRANREQLTGC